MAAEDDVLFEVLWELDKETFSSIWCVVRGAFDMVCCHCDQVEHTTESQSGNKETNK